MKKPVDLSSAVEMRTDRHDVNGYEHLDPTPIAVPLAFSQPDPVLQAVANVMASQALARRLDDNGFETEEEANDFDVPGDSPVVTSYEVAGDPRLDVLVAEAKLREAKVFAEAKANGRINKGSPTPIVPGGTGTGDGSGDSTGRSEVSRSVMNSAAPAPKAAPVAA